jgi:hypothetical protein
MMQKRKLYSLLLISFIVVFAASLSYADQVTVQSKYNLARCAPQAVNVTLENSSDAKGIEFVFEITAGTSGGFITVTGVNWDPAITAVFPDNILDLSQADGTSPDTIRFAAMDLLGAGLLAAGTHTVASIQFTTGDVCYDTVSIDNGLFDYPNPTAPITTQYVDGGGSIVSVAVTAGEVGIKNQSPTINAVNDTTIHWGDPLVVATGGDDPDLANGCEALTYALISPPAGMLINGDGVISWNTDGADVCDHLIQVVVQDECLAQDTTTFNVCVENTPPVAECPGLITIIMGDTLNTVVGGTDPDDGPYSLNFSLVSENAPGTVNVNPATGEVTWVSLVDPLYSGTFDICVSVSDSANTCSPCSPSNADTCCFQVQVIPFAVYIEKNHGTAENNYNGVVWGQEQTLDLTMMDAIDPYPMGGFRFVLTYDASAMTFMKAVEGAIFAECGWEYFTYRYGADGNCSGGCPSGILSITALAETNNGPYHPDLDCFDPHLATLHFLIANDRNLECQFAPVKFFWVECGDNTISSVGGDTLFMSLTVWDYVGSGGMDTWTEVTDFTIPMPNTTGAETPECDASDKYWPVRAIHFFNGGFDIICADSIDARGDVNVNGLAYEIADAVMFTNFFIEGLTAFGPTKANHQDASVAASDANADGISLSVADLVYLIRVVIGDAQPYPKDVVAQKVNYTVQGGVVNTQGDVELGAVHMVVAGRIVPELRATNMAMLSKFDGENTRILVYPDLQQTTPTGFTGPVLAGIDGEILSIDMATFAGLPVVATNVPTDYSLEQNYPNPFNPTTTVAFSTPSAGKYRLTIYNINGQVVDEISGVADAPGVVSIEWDASHNASGVYLYRLEINDFSQVKKMVLLK